MNESGAALIFLDRKLSFKELNKKTTPTQLLKYITTVSLYNLIKTEMPEEEWINLHFNVQNNCRNTRFVFQQQLGTSEESIVC